MGVYYKVVNLTKREQFEPGNIKASGMLSGSAQLMSLLLNDWCGDVIRMCNDAGRGSEEWEMSHDWPNRWRTDWDGRVPFRNGRYTVNWVNE